MKKVLYAELKVSVLVPQDELPEDQFHDPFESAVDNMKATIQQIEWEGLSDHAGVEIIVTDA